jgi:hypothetical protein
MCIFNACLCNTFYTMHVHAYRAEQILHASGVSIAPPERRRPTVVSFMPSQPARAASGHLWVNIGESSSENDTSSYESSNGDIGYN